MIRVTHYDTPERITFETMDEALNYLLHHEGWFIVDDMDTREWATFQNEKGHLTGPNGFSMFCIAHPTLPFAVVDHSRKEVNYFKNVDSAVRFIRQCGLGIFQIVDNKCRQRCFIERTRTGLYWTDWQKI